MMPGTVKGPHACQAYMPALLPQAWAAAFPKAEFGDQTDSTAGRMSLLHVLVPKAPLGMMS